jgi:hypothetical protein
LNEQTWFFVDPIEQKTRKGGGLSLGFFIFFVSSVFIPVPVLIFCRFFHVPSHAKGVTIVPRLSVFFYVLPVLPSSVFLLPSVFPSSLGLLFFPLPSPEGTIFPQPFM